MRATESGMLRSLTEHRLFPDAQLTRSITLSESGQELAAAANGLRCKRGKVGSEVGTASGCQVRSGRRADPKHCEDAQFRQVLRLDQLSGAVNAPCALLGIEPLRRTSQTFLVRDMVAAQRAIRLCSTTSAHCHPPVGFRRMMLVEPSAEDQCFR